MIISILLLTLSSLCTCGMSLFRKQYEKVNGKGLLSVLVFLCLSTFVICIGVFLLLGAKIIFNPLAFILAFALAIVSTLGVVVALVGLEYGNMTILALFARIGGIVFSCLYGLIFDASNNRLSIWKIIGFVFVAIILFLSFVKTKKAAHESETKTADKDRKKQLIFVFLCILTFFNGLALPILSIQTKYNPGYKELDFTALYMLFQLCISLIVFLIVYLVNKPCKKTNATIKSAVIGRGLLWILAYAVPYFAGEYLSLVCTETLPIIVQAPLSFTLSVVFIAVTDFLIYREKLSKKQLWQIGLAILTSVCFVL